MNQQAYSWAYIGRKLLKRYVQPKVRCRNIYNSQDVEATYMSIGRGVIKTM